MSYITNIPQGARFFAIFKVPDWVDYENSDRDELCARVKGEYLRSSIACHYFNLCYMGHMSIEEWQAHTKVACRKFVDKHARELFW